METLLELAMELGATDAAIINSKDIPIRDELAGYCLEPRCPNYGLSTSCPPHVGGPDELRCFVEEMPKAVVFKIDLPSEILFSSDRREVGRLVQEIAAGLEKAALEQGAKSAKAFAGGSCKRSFCDDQPDCNVVDKGGPCRHPESARPSMSGYGVDVKGLIQAAGWKMWVAAESDEKGSMGTLAGMVLIADTE